MMRSRKAVNAEAARIAAAEVARRADINANVESWSARLHAARTRETFSDEVKQRSIDAYYNSKRTRDEFLEKWRLDDGRSIKLDTLKKWLSRADDNRRVAPVAKLGRPLMLDPWELDYIRDNVDACRRR